MSSGSRRNSSKPNVPSGRTKMSTQRSTAGVDGLARTDQDGSRRADTAISVIVQPVPAVPGAGLEPARPFGQRLLRPPRLPFRHPGENATAYKLRHTVAGVGAPVR